MFKRVLGTALPLTMATFWANKAVLDKLKNAAATTVGRKENLMKGSFKILDGGVDNFNGQSVKTLSNKCLQRIIHKPMFGHSCEAIEASAAYTHPEVGTLPCAV
jgi:hypothetical protein